MANTLYPLAREQFLRGSAGSLDLVAGAVKVVFVDLADYTYSAAHQYLAAVDAGARVAVSDALASKTFTDGVFDAADPTVAAVSGDVFEALILIVDTGNEATSPLVAYIDTAGGLPYTPTGTDVTVSWSNGASKIFRL